MSASHLLSTCSFTSRSQAFQSADLLISALRVRETRQSAVEVGTGDRTRTDHIRPHQSLNRCGGTVLQLARGHDTDIQETAVKEPARMNRGSYAKAATWRTAFSDVAPMLCWQW